MSDEQNKISNSSSSNERIIAEAAKILLKNGLNGAAATTLLTAATFQLPLPASPPTSAPNPLTALAHGGFFQPPPPAHSGTAATASTVSPATAAHRKSSQSPQRTTGGNNNGLSSSSSPSPTPPAHFKGNKNMAAAAATATAAVRVGTPPVAHLGNANAKSELGGVLDYTVNSTSSIGYNNNNNHKFSNSSNHSTDAARNSMSSSNASNSSSCGSGSGSGYGGRLQFFKDGKFILELARSKDADKGGWVSVPRKMFRSPSATSSTVTPTSAIMAAFPKNESSTSLSFSDDNSSIQSSPWQRDHCWKQATPRRGISKEMCLLYRRPRGITLTASGLLVAYKKRRKPYNRLQCDGRAFERQLDETEVNTTLKAEESPKSVMVDEKSVSESDTNSLSASAVTEEATLAGSVATAPKDLKSELGEEDGCSSSSTATLIDNDMVAATESSTPTPTPTPPSPIAADAEIDAKEPVEANTKSENDEEIERTRMDCTEDENAEVTESKADSTLVEKMNTSDDEPKDVHTPEGNDADNVTAESNPVQAATMESKDAANDRRGGEKRLKRLKPRAKLNTIIQKLVDKIPTRLVHLAKTPLFIPGNGSGGTALNSPNNKISPPSATGTASRLVDHHHQHVSPRKRILREFEKVSLEDNAALAGGKRSRAKNNNATATGATNAMANQSRSIKSPTTTARAAASRSVTPTTPTNSTSANGNHQGSSWAAKTKATPTSAAPTRLYSSYSINSLLGGSSSSSSSSSPSSSNAKKANDQAVISSNSYNHHQKYTDPSYLRAMLASPNSPETNSNCAGGKSPSHSASTKRSPPYASPIHKRHSRSPHTDADNSSRSLHAGSGSASADPANATNYKMRHPGEQNVPTSSAFASNHHLTQHQSFYSPYMMSPKYVSAPSTSVSPSSSSTGLTRSPRHTSAFNSTSPYAPTSTQASTHIPNATNSIGSAAKREHSPIRSAPPPARESTPRTVPKKTASIRRQFASPTASITSSCSSPGERASEDSVTSMAQPEYKPPASISTSQSLMQRAAASPSMVGLGGLPSPLHYYMYPPPSNGAASLQSGNPTAFNTNSAAAAAATAAAAAYIPSMVSSYYYPYISTLAALRHNPMWMHHYSGGASPMLPAHHTVASSAAAAARMSPPFSTFPYNGVGAAAVAAAAAAAAFGGAPPPPAMSPSASHLSQSTASHLMAAPMLHSEMGAPASSGLAPAPKLTDNMDLPTTSKNHANSLTAAAADTTATTTTSALMAAAYLSTMKVEPSSDVPLNLSKH